MTLDTGVTIPLDQDKGTTGTKSMPGNLKIRGKQLFHYDTVIAEHTDSGSLIVNLTQYSIQTGNVQKQIKAALSGLTYTVVKKVPRDYAGSLVVFIK